MKQISSQIGREAHGNSEKFVLSFLELRQFCRKERYAAIFEKGSDVGFVELNKNPIFNSALDEKFEEVEARSGFSFYHVKVFFEAKPTIELNPKIACRRAWSNDVVENLNAETPLAFC